MTAHDAPSIAERLLSEAQELFRCVFDGSSDAFVVARRDDLRILDANPAFERMTGIDHHQALALEEGLTGVAAQEQERVALLEQIATEGSVRDMPLTVAPPDCEPRHLRVSARTIELEGAPCLLFTARDVTALIVSEAQRRRAMDALLTAEEAIRSGLALDLHDDTLQVLAAVVLDLTRIENRLTENDDADLAGEVHRVREAVADCADRTRQLMFQLRPQVLARDGLAAALGSLAKILTDGGYPELTLDVTGNRYDPRIEELVWRTVREAVINACRHAMASQITVTIRDEATTLEGVVKDNGIGFDAAAVAATDEGLHIGIDAMRERILGLDGSFAIDTHPGDGTTVHFTVPLQRDEPTL